MTTPKASARPAHHATSPKKPSAVAENLMAAVAPARAAPRAVQTELKSQLPYWMRWLPMAWFRDLIVLIHEASPKPSAMALGPLGAKNGILRKKDGTPLSESAMYHYRMALRHLGVVDVREGLYHVNVARPDVAVLLKAGRRGQPLAPAERDALSALILSNEDCRRIFLRLFMPVDRFTLAEFRANGSSCFIYYPENTGEIVVENHETRRRVRYQSVNAQHASIWGVRTWCLQLELLDELYLSPAPGTKDRRHILFPIDPARQEDAAIRRALVATLSLDAVPGAAPAPKTIEIADLLGRICPPHRLSARSVKGFLGRAAGKANAAVALIPAPASERPSTESMEGNTDRLHLKGWLSDNGTWHKKVTFQPSFWTGTRAK